MDGFSRGRPSWADVDETDDAVNVVVRGALIGVGDCPSDIVPWFAPVELAGPSCLARKDRMWGEPSAAVGGSVGLGAGSSWDGSTDERCRPGRRLRIRIRDAARFEIHVDT